MLCCDEDYDDEDGEDDDDGDDDDDDDDLYIIGAVSLSNEKVTSSLYMCNRSEA